MKNVMKEDDAVSPIIATILLIAITVTIIASAYSIFSGYVPTSSPSSSTVTIQYSNNTSASGNLVSGEYVFTFSGMSSNLSLKYLDAEILLQNGTAIDESMFAPYSAGYSIPIASGLAMNVSMPGGFLSYYGYVVISLNHHTGYISSFSIVNVRTGNRIAEVSFDT